MTDVVSHRGPDGAGHFVEGPVALGHRRLAIIDLSRDASQPMHSHDDRFVLTYNGEVYNYVELRAELRSLGSRFRTESDSEIIIEAYRVWGADAVRRFNGMWAFAIWDRERQQLFLSRDRLGIKPLFTVERPDAIAFASEVKSLLAAFPDERRPNVDVIRSFIMGEPQLHRPETFFASVRTFPAAHNAVFSAREPTARVVAQRYWRIAAESSATESALRDPVRELSELLDSAVELHMRSDVPVGTCLSGGVDSSTIVATMASRRSDPVHTYSGLYPDPECDESSWVDAVNRHCHTVATAVRPEPHGNLLDDMTTIGWHQDFPSAGPGLYTQFHVMRCAAHDVKVVLDGQGGDELFAGYLPYFRPRLKDLAASGAEGKARAAALAGAILWHWGRSQPATVARTLSPPWVAPLAQLARRRARLTPRSSLLHPSLAALGRSSWPDDSVGDLGARSALGAALRRDTVATSLPWLLHYEDRNSMAFSIEARVPLLDHRIVELAFVLDGGWKIRGSWTKWVLRKAAESRLPQAVTWRRSKLGYPTPFARWLRQPSERGRIDDFLRSPELRSRGVLAAHAIDAMWREHQAGADHSWALWCVISLEIWYRQFIDAWRPAPASPR